MFMRLVKLATVILTSLTSLSFAGCGGYTCVQSLDVGFGWRRDNLKWHVSDMQDSYQSALASSKFNFKDLEMYTVNAKAHWAGSEYYIRLSGDYGSSIKGRCHQEFIISSPILDGTLSTFVSNHVKRRSEFYDVTGAVGYPFMSCDNCLMVVPIIGFSFHRQRIRVKEEKDNSFGSDFSLDSSNPFFSSSGIPAPSSESISNLGSSGDFDSNYFFDPFYSDSPSNVAELIGFSPKNHTSSYRYTWFGPFVGVDIAYGLDDRWTIFTELEYHFQDRAHCKRNSLTAVDFVDDYHSERYAYGFNGSFGTTWDMGSCWYATIAVDFKWWKSNGHHDTLEWYSVGSNISLGYMY
jgi:hypothetical protein